MKAITLFFLFVAAQCMAQDKKIFTPEDIQKTIPHKWRLAYLQSATEKAAVPKDIPGYFLEFKQTGELLETDGKVRNEYRWSFDPETQTISAVNAASEKTFAVSDLSKEWLLVKTVFRNKELLLGFYQTE
jgi:hypothetical protein